MMVSWPRLFATIVAFFLVFDVLFGCLFHLDPNCIANLSPPGFLGDFFFSVETLATVGYGDMHPQNLYGHTLAMIEIFTGLLMLALITGLMFARFSRPRARFLFSRYAVVRPIDGKLTLMFRAANERQNVVQEARRSCGCCATSTSERLSNPPHHRSAARTLPAPRLRARLEHHARHRRDQPTQARDRQTLDAVRRSSS